MCAILSPRIYHETRIVWHYRKYNTAWCGPCQYIKPKFHALAEATPDVEFIAVDVDENEQAAAKAGVSCMPTFQFYKDGKMVEKLEGADEATLNSLVTKHK